MGSTSSKLLVGETVGKSLGLEDFVLGSSFHGMLRMLGIMTQIPMFLEDLLEFVMNKSCY